MCSLVQTGVLCFTEPAVEQIALNHPSHTLCLLLQPFKGSLISGKLSLNVLGLGGNILIKIACWSEINREKTSKLVKAQLQV